MFYSSPGFTSFPGLKGCRNETTPVCCGRAAIYRIAFDMDAPLSTAHYQEVRRALWTMKPQWRNIALVLGFPLNILNGFTGSDGDKMDQLLEVWLNRTYSTPTWRALVNALRDETVSGGNPVADEIEANIGQSSAGGAQRDLHPSPKQKRALLRQLSQDSISSSSTNESEISFPDFNCQFVVFITGLIEILEKHEGALPRMKTGLEQLVLPLRSRKFVRIVRSEDYKDATSVKELFRLLAPHWHCVDYNFLSTLVKVSECQAAEEKLQAFLQSSAVAASSLILQKAHATAIIDPTETEPEAKITSLKLPHQPGTAIPVSPSNTLTMPHTSNTADEKALLPAQRPLDEPICAQPQPLSQVQVEAKVDTDVLTLSDYEKHASILCGVLKLPRYVLSFFGTGTGCISVRWHMSSDLLPYVLGVRISDGDLQSLAEQKIVQIRIDEDFVLVIPTLSYWEEASVVPESQPLLPSSESAAKEVIKPAEEERLKQEFEDMGRRLDEQGEQIRELPVRVDGVEERVEEIRNKVDQQREMTTSNGSTNPKAAAYTTLTIGDRPAVMPYLQRISNVQTLLMMGESLGLDGTKLARKRTTDTFLFDLVGDWLHRTDKVDEKGMPSWKKLVEVLEEVGQKGLANDIRKDVGL